MIRTAAALTCIALATSAVAQDRRGEISAQQKGIRAAKSLGELQFAKERCGLTPNQDVVETLLADAMAGNMLFDVTFVLANLRDKANSFGETQVCKAILRNYGPNGSKIKGALLMDEG